MDGYPPTNKTRVNAKILLQQSDTGASHTIIDSTALMLAGIFPDTNGQVVLLETAKGIIEAKLTKLKSFKSLNKKFDNFEIQTYDFIAAGILSEYDGVIGLDFFENTHFCIDLQENSISFP